MMDLSQSSFQVHSTDKSSSILTSQNSPYLPGFLLGELPTYRKRTSSGGLMDVSFGAEDSSPVWPNTTSPLKANHQLNRSYNTPLNPGLHPGGHREMFYQNTAEVKPEKENIFSRSLFSPNGEPTPMSRLIPTANSTDEKSLQPQNFLMPNHDQFLRSPGSANCSQFSQAFENGSQLQQSFFSADQSSLYVENDNLKSNWVTVFGFHNSSLSQVLQAFSSFGDIAQYICNADGNWVHLHYRTKLQALKALARDGKSLDGSGIIIGVRPCLEVDVTQTVNKTSGAFINQNKSFHQQSYNRIRPLISPDIPKADNGILNKIWNWFF